MVAPSPPPSASWPLIKRPTVGMMPTTTAKDWVDSSLPSTATKKTRLCGLQSLLPRVSFGWVFNAPLGLTTPLVPTWTLLSLGRIHHNVVVMAIGARVSRAMTTTGPIGAFTLTLPVRRPLLNGTPFPAPPPPKMASISPPLCVSFHWPFDSPTTRMSARLKAVWSFAPPETVAWFVTTSKPRSLPSRLLLNARPLMATCPRSTLRVRTL
jgi:hypothetical protein